ncbi:hypothetical protein LTR72_002499 [Exophiala xenobiotica]|nr:hypothetical protein LTR72_002499 [Exophiala xenobiotica]KAK5487673.1 hypothetical protein LTR55_005045 [Exophiala xenobiotica]
MKITSSAQDAEGRDPEDTDVDPLVWANQFKGLFVRAVYDEGHKIKNPRDYKDRYEASLLENIETECPQYAERYGHMPMFIFDPRAFATLNTKDLLDGGVTTKAVQTLANIVILRNVSNFTRADPTPTTRDKFLCLSGGGTRREEHNYKPAESKKTVENHHAFGKKLYPHGQTMIRYQRIIQKPWQIVVVMGNAYHQRDTTGPKVAEAVNYAPPDWVSSDFSVCEAVWKTIEP